VTKGCPATPRIAIACGGTGGHFFPGVAVGDALRERGAEVTLLISPKKIDRQAARTLEGFTIRELPAVAFSMRSPLGFIRGFWRSLGAAAKVFKERPPAAVLAMGGFTSAAPIVQGWRRGAATFLHESNAIPGRANRMLAPWVDGIFAGLEAARDRFLNTSTIVTGTPVRPGFVGLDPSVCRDRLGLDVQRPTLLVMGGSQGARGVNDLMLAALPGLVRARPRWQVLHLAGEGEVERVRRAHERAGRDAQVHAFLDNMPAALGAADVAVSRAGASSLAELAAARLPSVLVPYPLAADDHQRHNARGFEAAGGAVVVEQGTPPSQMIRAIDRLMENRNDMRAALARQDVPGAADRVAAQVLAGCGSPRRQFKWMTAWA
jgi:UDP-N-acetylglucosamine--N-acetylmuramyl-(pentapeptide) pyrophosphoryl-undecaprenol N-acetylglucosamine transferase